MQSDNKFTFRNEADVLAAALKILETKSEFGDEEMTPSKAKDRLRLIFAGQEHESFVCLWLDAKNSLIGVDEMFRGSLTETPVYSREIVKKALARNASKVVVAHNHPSGNATPSENDMKTTIRLKEALELIDVDLLDHYVVCNSDVVSVIDTINEGTLKKLSKAISSLLDDIPSDVVSRLAANPPPFMEKSLREMSPECRAKVIEEAPPQLRKMIEGVIAKL